MAAVDTGPRTCVFFKDKDEHFLDMMQECYGHVIIKLCVMLFKAVSDRKSILMDQAAIDTRFGWGI
ncbi:hypothetical protein Pmar_PMAR024373 [Perkinsus marinus ATCC 50983]|uniref:Uncharacterized protein n=1 Tax=Perkinsus marinus (strain ATCC 50983 / TXsc) TaxID=423536 RepID=C5KLX1_PERM5|nr:hypothetical protein Pmar_PMAR024373 [Perkinsus marinus ATCC 50983]EER14486.1 hypothetical protein Pmar_PMAR024373 [Perkinsus marinus ATCC 50983]|eukprot:XP_002782691.1 hypothetical protein Pmar_PMAR024373 [Perkinsus marinus ATCC 50983]